MRKITFGLFLSCLCFSLQASTVDVIPDGWFKSGTNKEDYVVGVDDEVRFDDSKSAFITSDKDSMTTFATLGQNISSEDYVNQRIKVSAYVKTNSKVKSAQLWLRIDDETKDSNSVISFDNMGNRAISGETDWTQYSLVTDIPYEATRIAYGALLVGQGKMWFDNFKIEIVDENTPVTTTYYNSSKPRNLSFEYED